MGDVHVYVTTSRITIPEPMKPRKIPLPFPKGFARDIYTAICEPRQRSEGLEELDEGHVGSVLRDIADPPCGRGTKDCPKGYILVMLYTEPPPDTTEIPPLENAVGIAVASLGNYEGGTPTLNVRLVCSAVKGGGPTLLSILEQIARENRATHLVLTPVEAAKGWYETRGFVESAGYLRRPVPAKGARRTRRRRKGGGILARGTQNAVFSVPFPCDPPLGRKTVMLVSLAALGEGGQPSRRPLASVLERLRAIDPKAERFYYPLPCKVRAPAEGELIDDDLEGLSQSERERLVPFIDIVPYAPNGTLASRTVTPEIAAIVREDIEFLHTNGIAHGDVSKDNIVFDEADRPHLIDFGQSSLKVGKDGVSVPEGLEKDITSWSVAMASDEKGVARSLRSRGAGRRTRRSKASGKALYRRGSQSRTGSSRTNRSSYGLRGYSTGLSTW